MIVIMNKKEYSVSIQSKTKYNTIYYLIKINVNNSINNTISISKDIIIKEYNKYNKYNTEHIYVNNLLFSVSYFNLNRITHRMNEPAITFYKNNGKIDKSCYYLNGQEYTYEKFIKQININNKINRLLNE